MFTQFRNFMLRNRLDIAVSFIVVGVLAILVMLSISASRQAELQDTIKGQNDIILAQNDLIKDQNNASADRTAETQRLVRCVAEYFATESSERGAVLEDLETCQIRITEGVSSDGMTPQRDENREQITTGSDDDTDSNTPNGGNSEPNLAQRALRRLRELFE